MKISIGSDHAGFLHKKAIIALLESMDIDVIDRGTYSTESMDYPDSVHPVARDVKQPDVDFGIVICGSGNGVAITANKYAYIRAALCWNIEVAELARAHNDANVLAIPARFVSENLAKEMLKAFLRTPFEGGRHQRRIEKIPIR
ncbi:MAG TPA: ribose 5-phosphate isomerase B [Saprospiraceae bacterium]|nr:ribose 5-phosphate isomerase B [Saprospiraceae bacterium]